MTALPAIDHSAFKAFERDCYSHAANDYLDHAARRTATLNAHLLDALGAEPGLRWLDVACGPGLLSAAAAARGCKVTGLDYAEPMVELAREAFPAISFDVGDAEALPFESEQFDAVSCNFGILHFPHPEQAIAEAARVLVPGGKYAFTCWAPPPRNPFMALIFSAVQEHGTLDLPVPPGPPLFRFGDPDECARAVSEAGMEVVEIREVCIEWEFASADDILTTVARGTGRLGRLLDLQTPARRQLIEQAIVAGAEAHERDGHIVIPAPATLTVARRT
jgi:SAM-dependent methyltransferase